MSIVRKIHRWCGIALAILLIVIGLTGAIAAFRGELTQRTFPATRGAAPDPANFGSALDVFERDNPAQIGSAKLSPYGLATHRLFLRDGTRVWIDAQGHVVARWRGTRGIGEWALQIHHTLLAGEIGQTVTGIAGIAGIGMVVTGLVIYWPARRGFSWRLWPASGKRLALLKSHRNLALLLALPLMLQFASGAAMVFEGALRKLPGLAPPAVPAVTAAGPANWSAFIALARDAAPGGAVRGVAAPRSPDRPFVVNVQQPGDINPEGATRVFVAGGQVVAVADPAQQGTGARLLASAMGVHTLNYIGGLTAQLLLVLLGVLLAVIAALGGLAWLRAPGKSARKS